MGDYAKAEPLLRKSLAIDEAIYGEMDVNTATSLCNLGSLLSAIDRNQEARECQDRALKIRRQLLGDKHPAYADSLVAMADIYSDQEQWDLAEPLLIESLKISRQTNGDLHPVTGDILFRLAKLKLNTGNIKQAEKLIRETLKVSESAFGSDHPDYAVTLTYLADIQISQGKVKNAEPNYRRSLEISRSQLDASAIAQSARQQLLSAQKVRYALDDYISLAITDTSFAPQAYQFVLAWKGSTLERQSDLRRISDDETLAPLLQELRAAAKSLAALSQDVPAESDRNQWQKQVNELNDRKEQIEVKLSRRSQTIGEQEVSQAVDTRRLQTSLPKNAVLVDFLEYTRYIPPVDYQTELIAFVSCADRPLKVVNLGQSDPIREHIDTWREGLGDSVASNSAASWLSENLWKPIQPHAAGKKLLLLSPDGALGSFPFAVLPVDERGTLLIEQWKIAMIPVPRRLPAMMAASPTKQLGTDFLAMGNVAYNTNLEPYASKAGHDRSIDAEVRGSAKFTPLAGTGVEVKAIRELFVKTFEPNEKQIFMLEQSGATEQRFRELAPHCGILHLATHGFFQDVDLQSATAKTESKTDRSSRDRENLARSLSAGLFSGIAFAGANAPIDPSRDDGILTAEEIGSLNLERVDLAVLSACETGLGRVSGGEGLLGVQRSFQIAGARTTVASLWKVDDNATSQLMQRFYRNYWVEEMSKLDALHEAQLWMLRNEQFGNLEGKEFPLQSARGPTTKINSAIVDKPQTPRKNSDNGNRTTPRFWAAWSLSGDWR